MRKRQTRFNYGERCRPVSLDAYSLDSVSAYNSVRRKGAARSSKRSYGNPTFEDSVSSRKLIVKVFKRLFEFFIVLLKILYLIDDYIIAYYIRNTSKKIYVSILTVLVN